MNKLHIDTIEKKDHVYSAAITEKLSEELSLSLKDGYRMLVDSDNLAFIYVIESDEELYYLYFPEHTWSILKEIKNEKNDVELILNEKSSLLLSKICDELDYLTENIEGNGNYGEKMEQAVQRVFG